MAFLFNKFLEAVKVLAKSPTFARDPRQLQFEADINRLFLYTSYNRLGRKVEEADAEEIIEMASKASVADQQKLVQENIHSQIENFCTAMDEIFLPDMNKKNEPGEALGQSDTARKSGLSWAVGKSGPPTVSPAIPETRPLKSAEVSWRLKDLIGYTLSLKPSRIPHKEAGQGLFVDGEADVGTVIALYPGVIYTPAYYRYIPGYPRVDAHNTYLTARYDGTVINARPWGSGGEAREVWNGLLVPEISPNVQSREKGSDRFWKMLNKPLEGIRVGCTSEVIERRNPLALAHFANHPAKGMAPNVMICPYDFPLTEKDMRTYIPNIPFGNSEEVNMRRFGSFWFRSRSKKSGADVPVLKTLVLVATRTLCEEEVLLNYRLSNSKRRPEWYIPVDEEEERRRWS
ncbi:hypothetical protein P3X46_009229 [Hevea brasiliensis]|uniref:SET domain-containing protein n=1 Tax=Hevea brasiliensis TaxID=3981 RepID=A0ABQ9MQ93_HEVBR|nr:uncharacterized protein LOC110653482 [Hevea brasiliensis]KAJ9181058.1 hypothetical protein P3X46_009229 [Hevea brasiliensis]